MPCPSIFSKNSRYYTHLLLLYFPSNSQTTSDEVMQSTKAKLFLRCIKFANLFFIVSFSFWLSVRACSPGTLSLFISSLVELVYRFIFLPLALLFGIYFLVRFFALIFRNATLSFVDLISHLSSSINFFIKLIFEQSRAFYEIAIGKNSTNDLRAKSWEQKAKNRKI